MKNDHEDQAIRQVQRTVMFVGAVFVLVAFGYFSGFAAIGVLCGASIATLNLWILRRSVGNLLAGQSSGWVAAVALKFVALLGVIYLLIESGWVQPVGLAIGFGALPVGILLAGVLGVPTQSPSVVESSSLVERQNGAKSDHA